MTETNKQPESKFANHAASDPALAPKTTESAAEKKKGMNIAGKQQVYYELEVQG